MELFEAIAAGDVEVARRLLTADPALARVRHPSGPTPVLYALYHREAGLARELAGLAGPLDLPEAAALDEVDRVTEVLDADLLKAIDEVLDPVVTRDPALTESPAQRP